MLPHIKIYMKHFDLGEQDVIQCEVCGKQGRIDKGGFDIHHITGRGKDCNRIENLMALCRYCHEKAHKKLHPDVVQTIHNEYLKRHERTNGSV